MYPDGDKIRSFVNKTQTIPRYNRHIRTKYNYTRLIEEQVFGVVPSQDAS